MSRIRPIFRELRCSLSQLNGATSRVISSTSGTRDDGSSGKPGWMPGWIRSKLPAALGGEREAISEMENLTLDAFASSIKQARRLGGLTGWAGGTASAGDPAAQGTLRLFENIIGAMKKEEREDLSLFGPAERRRAAADAGCTVSQVDDCIARYLWMRNMTAKMAQLRREGKEMPKSIDEVERMLGSWRQHKSEAPVSDGTRGAAGSDGRILVPLDAVAKDGKKCALAGSEVGRNTKCPATKKAYKSCCGRK